MIRYGTQDIDDSDVEAVTRVLRSDFLTQGQEVEAFERSLMAATGASQAVAVASGTAALHLAYAAHELGTADAVWTSPISFVATANAALYCGARVDFVDVDPESGLLSLDALEEKLIQAEASGTLPRIVAPVHLGGLPVQMTRLSELAGRYGFSVVEDGAHALGARVEGRPVGGCQLSRATIFSFHPVKTITTGEGGAITTNDEAFASRCRRLRTHGIVSPPRASTTATEEPWVYEQRELGFNYRMTDLQAALGVSQMRRLDDFLTARRRLAARYDAAFDDIPVETPVRAPGVDSGWHLYAVRFESSDQRAEAYHRLREQGVGCQVHYIPIVSQPYYRQLGFALDSFPGARHYAERCLSLPLHPRLTEADQDLVVRAVRSAVTRSRRSL